MNIYWQGVGAEEKENKDFLFYPQSTASACFLSGER